MDDASPYFVKGSMVCIISPVEAQSLFEPSLNTDIKFNVNGVFTAPWKLFIHSRILRRFCERVVLYKGRPPEAMTFVSHFRSKVQMNKKNKGHVQIVMMMIYMILFVEYCRPDSSEDVNVDAS
jgi:hypothetical protein